MRQYSESTLMGMTKKELVQEVLITYHNRNAAETAMRQQAVKVMGWEPVRHGHWDPVTGSNKRCYMVCSSCRQQQDLTGVFSYCPNCGAKMDEGAEENG